MSKQPEWKPLCTTDYSRVEVDQTGHYDPEMEVAQDIDGEVFEVFRFPLERFQLIKTCLVPYQFDVTWFRPARAYKAWFQDDLSKVADFVGTSYETLLEAFCSSEIHVRAWAWESVGSYHGFTNLDQYPLTLTQDELNERWA